MYVQEIEDIKNVDKRRADMGMPSLHQYIIGIREMVEDDEIKFPEGYEYKNLN